MKHHLQNLIAQVESMTGSDEDIVARLAPGYASATHSTVEAAELKVGSVVRSSRETRSMGPRMGVQCGSW